MTYVFFQISPSPSLELVDPQITPDHLPQDFRFYSLVVADYSRRQMAAATDVISRYVASQ